MKKFVLGFIVGALLFTALPIGAAIEEYICYKADYKVMVNGVEYISEDLPILNYKGYTYAPFRSILEAAGLTVDWNGELRQASVTTPKTQESEDVKMTSDGITIHNIDGVDYVLMGDVCLKYPEFTFGKASDYSPDNKTMAFIRESDEYELISNMPYHLFKGRTYVTVEYYENTILPIIRAEN